MTADGLDRGTPEHKNTEDRSYVTTSLNFFKRGKTTIQPNISLDRESMEAISKVLDVSEDPENSRVSKYFMPLLWFLFATGGLPKDQECREKVLNLFCSLLDYEEINESLTQLRQFLFNAQERNLADNYRGGKITPELVRILNDTYEPPEALCKPPFSNPVFLISQLLNEKKIDFSAFKDNDAEDAEWFFEYDIRVTPLPVEDKRFGTLNRITERAEYNYMTLLSGIKETTKARLKGVRPTKDWLKKYMKLSDEKAEEAMNSYIVKPVPAEILLKLAELVELQYQQRRKERTRRNYSAPFATPYDAGFYVNPVTLQIYDLRPHAKELHQLMSVKNWNYLADFAAAVREAVAEFTGEAPLREEPTRAELRKAKKINYPVDKVNNNLWGTIERNADGQLAFSTAKTGKKKEITILVAINFVNMQGVKITKKLTNFDKRVYIAVSALWNAGNRVVTLTQIHYAMGNTNRPAKYQLEKINEAVSKMTTAKLYLDNAYEVERLKYKYAKFKYDGALLPIERMTATVKGQLSDAAIHIFREPPLMTFARERNQITTFDVKLLQSPVNKTDANLAIEDYLIERIAGAKNAAAKGKKVVINTVLYETLFEKTGIKNRLQRARAIDKIKTYLDYYKSNGYIKDYKTETKQFTFYF